MVLRFAKCKIRMAGKRCRAVQSSSSRSVSVQGLIEIIICRGCCESIHCMWWGKDVRMGFLLKQWQGH